jgi:hypothetical protein
LDLPTSSAELALVEICNQRGVGIEDWSTVRFICAECSRGNPGPHSCATGDPSELKKVYAFASESEAATQAVLNEWKTKTPDGEYSDLKVVVA